MTPRLRRMTRAEALTRKQHALAFLTAADLVTDLGDDAGVAAIGNTVGSLAVLAGIAASDAICGAVLGERAAGESHTEAIALLRRASPDTNFAAQLRRLIDSKTEVQYSPALITEARAAELLVSARRLVHGAASILRGLP